MGPNRLAAISRMADSPLDIPCQKDSVPQPKALTTPVPVMTTRCMLLAGGRVMLCLHQLRDSLDHFVNRPDLFRLLIINFDIEFALQIKNDIQTIQRVDVQRLKAAVRMNSFNRNALGSRDYL